MRLILVPEFDNLYVLHPAALFLFSRTKIPCMLPRMVQHGLPQQRRLYKCWW